MGSHSFWGHPLVRLRQQEFSFLSEWRSSLGNLSCTVSSTDLSHSRSIPSETYDHILPLNDECVPGIKEREIPPVVSRHWDHPRPHTTYPSRSEHKPDIVFVPFMSVLGQGPVFPSPFASVVDRSSPLLTTLIGLSDLGWYTFVYS